MQFLYPSFLWAAGAIAIPILIHLFHFRRFRKVYFPNIKFLKEIKEETSSRNKLRNLLVLLARILAILSLVMAFAQPFIPQGEEVMKGRKAVSLFIDNSFSMNSIGEDISLLDKAKLDAVNIVEAYETGDVFQILTHDASSSGNHWLTREEAIQWIDQIGITYRVRPLSRILAQQRAAFPESQSEYFLSYWLSDFQRSIIDITGESLDSSVRYYGVKLNSVNESNVGIDSCWWVAPIPVMGQVGNLIVRMHNYSGQDIEDLALNLNYDGQNFPQGKLDVPANGFRQDTIRFTLQKGGWNQALVSIRDYPVRFDDDYWIAFEVSQTLPVLIISERQAGPYTRAVFETSPIFEPEYLPITRIDYGSLDSFKLIVLEDINAIPSGLSTVLLNYMEAGGNLLIFPGPEADLGSFNEALRKFNANLLDRKEIMESGVGALNREEFVFKGVFDEWKENITLPTARMRYISRDDPRKRNRQLLRFRDGRSFVDVYDTGAGHLYFSSVPLSVEVTDLVQQAEIFAPMVYRMALSSGVLGKISYTIGKDQLIPVTRRMRNSEVPYRMTGDNDFIPGMRNIGSVVELNVMDQIERAGIYKLVNGQDTIKSIAFNYDRLESDLTALSADEIGDRFGETVRIFASAKNPADLKQSITEEEKGIVLWKWFLILALVFLGVEVLLLRWVRI